MRFFAATLIFFSVAIGNAVELKSVSLKSVEGTNKLVQYAIKYENLTSNKPNQQWVMNPLTFLVSGDAVKSDSKIRVIFVNKVKKTGQCGLPSNYDEYTYYVDLKPSADGFTGDLINDGYILWGIGSERKWEKIVHYQVPVQRAARYCSSEISLGQEVAVVVDGVWQQEPYTGRHNFYLNIE
jgi:hypothetical protein